MPTYHDFICLENRSLPDIKSVDLKLLSDGVTTRMKAWRRMVSNVGQDTNISYNDSICNILIPNKVNKIADSSDTTMAEAKLLKFMLLKFIDHDH